MNSFPVLRSFKNSDEVYAHEQAHPVVAKYANKLAEALDQFGYSLWSAQSVVHFVEGKTLEEMAFTSIPCSPPFNFIWIEYVGIGGVHRATTVSRYSYRDEDGEDSFLVHSLYLDKQRNLHMIASERLIRYNDDGTVRKFAYSSAPEFDAMPEEERIRESNFAWNGMAMALTAFMFSHCKNVELVERLPKRHEQRAAKRLGEPILKYHEIVIDPNKTQQPSTGANRHDDKPHKALHIARGHFAHYTEERPLFGKYVGTFWRPAHVRGSAELGEVKSTYRVKGRPPATPPDREDTP